MKKTIFLFLVLSILSSHTFAQLKLNEKKSPLSNRNFIVNTGSSKMHTGGMILLTALFLVNPDVIIEDKKAYFGLTKELSAGRFPFGRAEFEYTYVFRQTRNNNFRLSYNLDVPLYSGGTSTILFISPGFGYYADSERNGLFGQLTFGVMTKAPMGPPFAIHPYLKLRRTFIKGKSLPDIFDISLGIGLALFNL